MNIKEFRTVISDCIKCKVGDAYTIIENDAIKNNGIILHGITFKRSEGNIFPTIYLERYKREYEKGKSIEEIAQMIISDEKSARIENEFNADFFRDYNSVRDKLYVKLVNTEKNKKIIDDIPSREFMDLSMVVYCEVESIINMDASILVKNEHIEMWGVDKDELIDLAYENTRSKGIRLMDMCECIDRGYEESCNEDENYLQDTSRKLKNEMYVLSNNKIINGAIVVTFRDVLDDLCRQNNTSYYIIPSSVNEVLLVSEEVVDGDVSRLNSMIRSVNRDMVRVEEVLSDHAYYYNTSEGYVSV